MQGITVKGIVFNWFEAVEDWVVYRSECGNIDLTTYLDFRFYLRGAERWRADIVGPAFAGINEPAIDAVTPGAALAQLRRRLADLDETGYREAAETHIAALKALSKENK